MILFRGNDDRKLVLIGVRLMSKRIFGENDMDRLFRVADFGIRNSHKNELRRRLFAGCEDELSEEELTAANETADHILSCLDISEREFLNLRYGLQLSDKEIGAMLDEKENTINKRYQRLLKKCRDIANG